MYGVSVDHLPGCSVKGLIVMKHVLLTIAVLLVALLGGCSCQHQWSEASCEEPSRCRICGQLQGEAQGHNFSQADCEVPQTCGVCGLTEGEALGHSWVEATCEVAKTCSVCSKTEGKPSHQWLPATCRKRATCVFCKKTTGERLPHHWVEATCTTSKNCTLCGKTEGAALGHRWVEATCTEPKICDVCAITDGEALNHSWTELTCTQSQVCLLCGAEGKPATGHNWLPATCDQSVRCANCGTTQGLPLGHQWEPATTERPKTCVACGKTEGLPIELDDRFLTTACQGLFGFWQCTKTTTAEELAIPGCELDLVERITYQFGSYGDLLITTEVQNRDDYKTILAARLAADKYAQLEAKGMNKEEADAYFWALNGKTVTQYARDLVEISVTEADFRSSEKQVYYVADGMLHLSDRWDAPFSAVAFCLAEDELQLLHKITGETLVLTRISSIL